jgi:hypothetical protein
MNVFKKAVRRILPYKQTEKQVWCGVRSQHEKHMTILKDETWHVRGGYCMGVRPFTSRGHKHHYRIVGRTWRQSSPVVLFRCSLCGLVYHRNTRDLYTMMLGKLQEDGSWLLGGMSLRTSWSFKNRVWARDRVSRREFSEYMDELLKADYQNTIQTQYSHLIIRDRSNDSILRNGVNGS